MANDVTSAPPVKRAPQTADEAPIASTFGEPIDGRPTRATVAEQLRRGASNSALIATLGVALLYAAAVSGHLTSIDGYLMWQQANALVFHHTLLFEPPIQWETHTFPTSYFAIGLSLAYAPGLFIWSLFDPEAAARITPQVGGPGMYGDMLYTTLGTPVHILATALSTYLVARIIRQLGFSARIAVLGLVMYALSSLAFVYARGDYAQPLESLCWLAALSAATSMRQSSAWMPRFICALAIVFAILTRTLEGLMLAPAVVIAMVPAPGAPRPTRSWLAPTAAVVCAGLAVGIAVTAGVNQFRYGNVFETGYGTADGPGAWTGLWSTPLLVGLAGSLVSPARGILWAAPFVLLAPLGVWLLWRGAFRPVALSMVMLAVLLLLMTSKWFAWWGGLDWGLRLFLPAMSMLFILGAIGTTQHAIRVSPWFIGTAFVMGFASVLPAITTDPLGGYGGLSDATAGSFRWEAFPPIGSWQYVKHILPSADIDTSSIDLYWVKIARQTHGLSLVLMGGLITAALVCFVRAYALLWPGVLSAQFAVPFRHLPSTPLRNLIANVKDAGATELTTYRTALRGQYRSPGFVAMVVLLATSLSLRLFRLDYVSFWLDETVQYGWAKATLGDMLFKLQPDQLFLNSYISHFLIRVHLDSIWDLRLPSALAGIAAVIVMWRLAHALFGQTIGIVVGLLTAFWPALVLYSQEYRPYALEVLLASLTLLALVRGYQTNHGAWWMVLALAAVLYMYNHMTSVIAVVTLGIAAIVWLAMTFAGVPGFAPLEWVQVRKRLGYLALTAAVIATGYLPGTMILARFLALSDSTDYIAGVKTPLILSPSILARIFGKDLGLGDGVALALTGGLCVIGLAWAVRWRPYAAALIVVALAAPLLIFAHTSGGGSLLNSQRYVLFLSPMYLVAIGAGLVVVGGWLATAVSSVAPRFRVFGIAIPALALAVPVALMLHTLYVTNLKEIPVDLRSAYQDVFQQARPGDMVLQTSITKISPAQWYDYYDDYFLRNNLHPAGIQIARLGQDWGRPEPVCLTLKDAADAQSHPRVCLATADLSSPDKAAALSSQIPPLANPSGRVWMMVTATPPEQADLASMVGSSATLTCYTGICVVSDFPDAAATTLRKWLPRLAPLAI